jgi:hypothetical protein
VTTRSGCPAQTRASHLCISVRGGSVRRHATRGRRASPGHRARPSRSSRSHRPSHSLASPEGVAAPIPARPVPGAIVPAEAAATPEIRISRDDWRGCYDRRGNRWRCCDGRRGRRSCYAGRRCGIRIWVGVLRLRGPCCESAEHDQKARNCEHGFPTSRHDLFALLIVIEVPIRPR